jgi:pyruvate kinase
MKRTKIVATIGPACESMEILEAMMHAGMNIARLNFSHGTYENHAQLIHNIRTIASKLDLPIAIMQDVQGPKIRLGILPDDGIVLEKETTVCLDTSIDTYTDNMFPLPIQLLHEHVQPGERILLSDGTIELRITHTEATRIFAKVVVGGTVFSHKGVNIPDTHITLSALTDKDVQDLAFGVAHDVDIVAVSFVRSAEDILDAKFAIEAAQTEQGILPEAPIKIIAKIERPDAVTNIDEILSVADGIMVARGDLGIEISAAEVPLVQKNLIERAMKAGKPVIVATQMLDSMQHNPRPTRAEVSDVANAVIDHTDAVMLSNETATGQYPIETVQTMADIIVETEASKYDDYDHVDITDSTHQIDDILTNLSRTLSEDIAATLILAASISGETGRLISRNRPELPIVLTTSNERVRRQLNLSWGVMPYLLEPCRSLEELVERSLVMLKRIGMVASQDKIVVVAGEPVGHAGHVNLLEVRTVT